MFVCALPLVSKSENAKEVLCALRWPLSASKSENAAKVRPLMHPVRVRWLCCLLCGYTSHCMREGCAAHCVAYTSPLPVDANNCPTPSSKPASHPCSVSTLCNSGVRLVQLPRPLASTSLATRCPHMRRLEVHRPARGRRGCRCLHMHRLKVHRPLRVRRACRCQQKHRLKVH